MIESSSFGQMPDGTGVRLYELRNTRGMVAKVTEYGAILTELWVPDARGEAVNVVLGFDHLADYLKGHPFFGATTGRFANRIAKESSSSTASSTPWPSTTARITCTAA
jgi:aldose 1-epimerase